MKPKFRGAGALAMALLVLACDEHEPEAAGSPSSPELHAIMAEFTRDLRIVLPRTVDDGFADPAQRAEIHPALQRMARDAGVLAAHSREGVNGARYLGRSLERDTAEILRQFERRRYDRASFLLRQVTENCIVCHSRLPSPGDSPLATDFVDRTALVRLRPEQRAALQIATRRFDDSLDTLERGFESRDWHPALMLGPLTDYLTISIRVKDDYVRPIPVLRRLAARPDLWTGLRLDIEAWIAALPELRQLTRGAPELGTARMIIQDCEVLGSIRDPREGLVHLIAASSVLQRYIEAKPDGDEGLAEAYYLLGLTEARIGRNYWVTEAGHFLETAIRLDPAAPFAEDAYGRLEEEIYKSYEGVAREKIDREDAKRLSELRKLIDDGR